MKIVLSDIRRYQAYERRSAIFHFLTQRSLWAIFQYRVANSIYNSKLPGLIRKPLLIIVSIWRIIIEITTGISIPHSCIIGKGLYIGHPGNIIFNANARLGDYCNVSQGVTVGVSGRRGDRGVPIIGNYVYMAANSVIVGKIVVGDRVVVGANSVVTRNVEPDTTVMGVPAVKISNQNSLDFILPTE